MLPGYQDDYRFEMSGAHRKPAYKIEPPSVTWHLGFWKPEPEHEKYNEKSRSFARRDIWIGCIEELILHVYDSLKDHKKNVLGMWDDPSVFNYQPIAQPRSDRLRLLRNVYDRKADPHGKHEPHGRLDPRPQLDDPLLARYETVHIHARWNGMPIDIRFEVTGEYFTVTTTISLRQLAVPSAWTQEGRSIEGKGQPNFNSEIKTEALDFLSKIIRATDERVKCQGRDFPMAPSIIEVENGSKFLYFGVWEKLEADIFRPADPGYQTDKLGTRFADFRGLALQCDFTGSSMINASGQAEAAPELVRPNLRRVFDRELSTAFTDDLRALRWVDAIHPILLSIERDEVNTLDKRPVAADPVEYIFTKFCNERCIYGSGWGPQEEGGDRTAVR